MQRYSKEFRTLSYVISQAEHILLFAHNRPDPDTVGANLALAEHLESLGKHVDIACFNPFPDSLKGLAEKTFFHPDQLDLKKYDAVIGCDSVDRGLDTLINQFREEQVIVLIDHHPDIDLKGDVVIIDPSYSSTSELLYLYLASIDAPITKSMATMLLMGILFDTGGFQHGGVSPQVMEIASELMKKGAPLPKISQTIFTNKNIGAMKLWGKAFEKAKFNKDTGMLVTAVTQKDIAECDACAEDIYQVASILSTVPDAKFAMVLSERDACIVRASLRSMEHHGIDVSLIAHQFGGGGHKLASGFEVPGKIIETPDGFAIA